MADFKRSSSKYSKKISNVNNFAFNNTYDDVFGGPPKFAVSSFSSRIDDYGEIFGDFYPPKSSSSIPVLDFPDEDEVDFRSSNFNYSDVFGGFDGRDFAISHEEIFAEPKVLENPSIRTAAETVYSQQAPETVSGITFEGRSGDPFSDSENHLLSNGASHRRYDCVKQFKTSYNKANQRGKEDSISGTIHIAQLDEVSGFTFVVDSSSPSQKTKCEKSQPQVTNDLSHNVNSNSEMMEGKLFTETASHAPACSKFTNSGNDPKADKKQLDTTPTASKEVPASDQQNLRNSGNHMSSGGAYSGEVLVTVSEISRQTHPFQVPPGPPPSTPPPKLVSKEGGSGRTMVTNPKAYPYEVRLGRPVSANKTYHVTAASETFTPKEDAKGKDGSPPFFDVEVDPSSAAAASAAAVKEAMEKAQTWLKRAKESMERKRDKDNCQSRVKMGMTNEKKGREKRERRIAQENYKPEEKADDWKPKKQSYEMAKNDEVKLVQAENSEEKLKAPGKLQSHEQNVKKAAKLSVELENNEKSSAVLEAHEHEEHGKKLEAAKVACEQEENDKKVRATQEAHEREEFEKKLKAAQEAREREELEKLKAAREARKREENEKRLKAAQEAREREEFEKLKAAREAREREENEKRIKAAQAAREQEENEKRLKAAREAREQEENEKRLKAAQEAREREEFERLKAAREAREREEIEKRLKAAQEAREREENEKRLKAAQEAREREENEKRLKVAQEAREREENEKRLKAAQEAHEREENEKRLKDAQEAREREENKKRLKAVQEAREREENEKRLKAAQAAREREEFERLKAAREAREREEYEKRLKAAQEAREREENEKRLKAAREARERDEFEKSLKAAREAREREEFEKRLKAIQEARDHEEEQKLKASKEAHECEECDKKLEADKDTREREENEMKLKAAQKAHEKEQNEKKLKAASEQKDVKKRSKAAKACESEERDQKFKAEQEACEQEENQKKLQVAQEVLDCENEKKSNAVKEAHQSENTGKELKLAQDAHEQDETDKKLKAELVDDNKKLKAAQGGSEHEERANSIKGANESFEREVDEKNFNVMEKKMKLAKEAPERVENEKNIRETQVALDREENKNKFNSDLAVFQLDERGEKLAAAQHANALENKKVLRTAPSVTVSPDVVREEKNSDEMHSIEEKEKERMQKGKDQKRERLRKIEEEREREREREKDRLSVERATREARERAERIAVERVTAEARQRALAEAHERAEKASAEAREKLLAERASIDARLKAERAAVERATAEARERALERAIAEKAAAEAKERAERSVGSNVDIGMGQSRSFSDVWHFDRDPQNQGSYFNENSEGNDGESAERYKARLERYQRTAERAAKALTEKNLRDILAQREQTERNRLAETLDAEIRRWSNGKEGNLRALLSTLQYILGPDSGWQPIPLTDLITPVGVKKAYRKATLCVHPDKLQQRGASIQQKYICEKIFDMLKEAWNKFSAEVR
ncbi:uncharacterized protein LOC143854398 [Tasmannia lanceolata]|uniref:uncharacterized protein LOC143854398 n=1 Tax=Tasmannia lanceolata TaxID=3420 RepID=UPI004063F97D